MSEPFGQAQFPVARRWWAHLPDPDSQDLFALAESVVRGDRLWADRVPVRDDHALRAALTEAGWHPGEQLEHIEELRAHIERAERAKAA